MMMKQKQHKPLKNDIPLLAREKAMNLYDAQRLCCSESVVLVCNEAFGGTLSEEEAIRLSSGFCGGIGGSGCTCGVLTGAILVFGFLSGTAPGSGVMPSAKPCRFSVSARCDRGAAI